MKNANASGCCCAKSTKAEEQPDKTERKEKTRCCGTGEAPESTGIEAATAEARAIGSAARPERKGCC